MTVGTTWPGKNVFFDGEVLPQIYRLIDSATDTITFVTPYLGLWEHLKGKLDDAIGRKVRIFFLIRAVGEDKVPRSHPQQDIAWLRDRGVILVEVRDLHAKIYMNEKTLLLSSMNTTQASIANSHEFAVMLRDGQDAQDVREYVSSLLKKHGPPELTQSAGEKAAYKLNNLVRKLGTMSVERVVKAPQPAAKPQTIRIPKSGVCIRCKKPVNFDTTKPLCGDCYVKWLSVKNRDQAEKYCHMCGKAHATTLRRPLCLDCYRKTTRV